MKILIILPLQKSPSNHPLAKNTKKQLQLSNNNMFGMSQETIRKSINK